MFLLWCQQDPAAVFWKQGRLPPPLPEPPCCKGVPSELPSCIHFPRELLNVTLEGAAAPQASSSPPPSAVVGCKSHAWRQLLCSPRGPALRLPKQTSPTRRVCALGAPRPDPPAPSAPLHSEPDLCISPKVRFTECADPWHPSSHAAATAPPPPSPCASFPHLCTLPCCT